MNFQFSNVLPMPTCKEFTLFIALRAVTDVRFISEDSDLFFRFNLSKSRWFKRISFYKCRRTLL